MAPSLRENKDADGDSVMSPPADTSEQQLSGDPFPLLRLPREIVDNILTLACRAPESDMSAGKVAKRSLLALDVKTTLNLTQVSRSFGDGVVRTLYHAVRITKPSALIELLRTLKVRPDLGKLIKHLHIGADKTLVRIKWPLIVELDEDGIELEYPIVRLKTSLCSHEDEELVLPKWCQPGRSWNLEPGRVDCRGAAVGRAVRAAVKKIDIEPFRRQFSSSGKRIGRVSRSSCHAGRIFKATSLTRSMLPPSPAALLPLHAAKEEWTIRLFLLQAALDLYLVQMRRHEDAQGYDVSPWRAGPGPGPPQCPAVCRLGNCKHYLRLVLTDSTDPSQLKVDRKKQTIKMPMGVLWLNLTERGGQLDQFDHPILFARAGLKSAQLNEYGQDLIRARLTGPAGPHFAPSVYDPEASEDEDFESDDSDESSPTGKAAKGFDPPDMAPNHTMPGIINRACDVLFLTPNVVILSINGFLQLCLCIRIPVFETMRSFALGPLLPFFAAAVCFNDEKGPKMAKLGNLLISGDILMKDEAERIAGKEGRLPGLKRFQWEMVQTTKPYEE